MNLLPTRGACSSYVLPCIMVLLAAVVLLPGCYKRPTIEGAAAPQKLTATAFINQGKALHLIVDVRASMIAGPEQFLPLQVALLNRSEEQLRVTRESFVLEGQGRARLPLASYTEFSRNYPRHRVDLRIGRELIEHINGRYHQPPYQLRQLEFFPERHSGVVPRDEIELRQGQIAVGFLYFSLPDPEFLPDDGRCTLLLSPIGGEQYVIDVQAYKKKKEKKA